MMCDVPQHSYAVVCTAITAGCLLAVISPACESNLANSSQISSVPTGLSPVFCTLYPITRSSAHLQHCIITLIV